MVRVERELLVRLLRSAGAVESCGPFLLDASDRAAVEVGLRHRRVWEASLLHRLLLYASEGQLFHPQSLWCDRPHDG